MPQTEFTADQFSIVLITCPDLENAESIAGMLVEKHLAACVNIVPGVISLYRWKDQLEKSQEFLLIAKTSKKQFSNLANAVKAKHPYELPEIINVPLSDGLPDYLSWIQDNVAEPQ